jgi:lipopolysaccharide transport system ATP-binding protein
MTNTVITVENLSKKYSIRHQNGRHRDDGLRHVLEDAFLAPWRLLRKAVRSNGANGNGNSHLPAHRSLHPAPSSEEFWALKDVSFEVKQGQVVGIIGRNGAGKSTLLKILSQITEPTEGKVGIKGRVASLLEVGTGFHPELTGRENIYLNGAILGMKRTEIKGKFDEIVSFAEIEKFLDTPVKRYSSGMYVRLAFAVAAHLEPEILIVDEVLAVGDAEFQEKCLGRMDAVAKSGRTVLFVSHNLQAVSALTTRCLLLSKGAVVGDGDTGSILSAYLRHDGADHSVYVTHRMGDRPQIVLARIYTSDDGNVHFHGKPFRLVFDIFVPERRSALSFSFQVVNHLDEPIIHSIVTEGTLPNLKSEGTHRIICEIPKLRLYMGRYCVTAHLADREGVAHFQTLERLCPFDVVMHGVKSHWRWRDGTCKYLEECCWQILEPIAVNHE